MPLTEGLAGVGISLLVLGGGGSWDYQLRGWLSPYLEVESHCRNRLCLRLTKMDRLRLGCGWEKEQNFFFWGQNIPYSRVSLLSRSVVLPPTSWMVSKRSCPLPLDSPRRPPACPR